MTRTELVNQVAKSAEISQDQAEVALDTVLSSISDSLCSDESVQFLGFGTFSSKMRPARKARNPRTGEEIDVPEKRVVKFKPSSKLADKVAEGK